MHRISSYSLNSKTIGFTQIEAKIQTELSELMIAIRDQNSDLTIDVVVQKITEIMNEIQENQKKHEEIYKKMQDQCKDEESFRRQEITNANEAFNMSLGASNLCSKSLAEASSNLPLLKNAQGTYNVTLSKAEAQRKKDHDDYVTLSGQLQELITFLSNFLSQIDLTNSEIKNLPSLFELGENLLKKAAKLGKIKEIMPIFLQLAEDDTLGEQIGSLAVVVTAGKKASVASTSSTPSSIVTVSSGNISSSVPSSSISTSSSSQQSSSNITSNYTESPSQKTLEELRKNVQNLVTQVKNDLNRADIEEGNSKKIFTELQKNILGIIDILGKDIIKTVAQISLMNACTTKENSIMMSATGKMDRNGKLQELAKKTCKDFETEFVVATLNRKKEVQAINDILFIIKKRFGDIKKLEEVVSNLLKSFKPYMNMTVFVKYQEYKKQSISDNANGRTLSGN